MMHQLLDIVYEDHIVPYSISCVGANGGGTKWMPRQMLQTTGNSVVGGRSQLAIDHVKGGASLASLVQKKLAAGADDADPAQGGGEDAVRLHSAQLELLATPCAESHVREFSAQGFGDHAAMELAGKLYRS